MNSLHASKNNNTQRTLQSFSVTRDRRVDFHALGACCLCLMLVMLFLDELASCSLFINNSKFVKKKKKSGLWKLVAMAVENKNNTKRKNKQTNKQNKTKTKQNKNKNKQTKQNKKRFLFISSNHFAIFGKIIPT